MIVQDFLWRTQLCSCFWSQGHFSRFLMFSTGYNIESLTAFEEFSWRTQRCSCFGSPGHFKLISKSFLTTFTLINTKTHFLV